MNIFDQYASGDSSMESSVEHIPQYTMTLDSACVDDTMTVLASLEALADDLSKYHSAGYDFTSSHAKLLHVNLLILGGMNRDVPATIIPSLESDNPQLRTDIVASMEGVGSAIKAGAKAFWGAIKSFLSDVKKRFLAMTSAIKTKAQRAIAGLKRSVVDVRVTFDTRILTVTSPNPDTLLNAIVQMLNAGIKVASDPEWDVLRQSAVNASVKDAQEAVDTLLSKVSDSMNKISNASMWVGVGDTYSKYGYVIHRDIVTRAPKFKYTTTTTDDKYNFITIPASGRKKAIDAIEKTIVEISKTNVMSWVDNNMDFYSKLSLEFERYDLKTDRVRSAFDTIRTYLKFVQFSYVLPTHVLERISQACNESADSKVDDTGRADRARTVKPAT